MTDPVVGTHNNQPGAAVIDPGAPIRSDQLGRFFTDAARSDERTHMVGTELEKFGVVVPSDDTDLLPVGYDHIGSILEGLCREFDWEPGPDQGINGEIIELRRDGASITLEPGGQLELSGKPLSNVHETCAEFTEHYHELDKVSQPLRIAWFAAGFHPWATRAQINWMPKGRYTVMGAYLPTRGPKALDMMLRTSTVQANFDYASERQCGERLRVANAIAPIVMAIFANSPFEEGRLHSPRSLRSLVWEQVDPDRCGTPTFALKGPDFRFDDYIQWALDVPMFFVKRAGHYHPCHKPFRAFMKDGFVAPDGGKHYAVWSDWVTHLSTVFPEVRLKPYVEFRSADAVPSAFVCAVPALLKAILYDGAAGAEAWERLGKPSLAEHTELWAEARQQGLRSARVLETAKHLLEIARVALDRAPILDSKGRSEARFLDPVDDLLERKICPADLVVEALGDTVGYEAAGQRKFVRACHFAGVTP